MLFLKRCFLILAAACSIPAFAADDTQKPAIQPANVRGETKEPKSDLFNVLPGFQVEKLFAVPKEKYGSWVAITTDPKGRLIVSDQGDKGLYRITPPTLGSTEETKVERLAIPMTAAHSLLFAFGNLYISANGGPGSGLYKCSYDSSTDTFGKVVKLKSIRGGGEHGPHGIRLSPDGKSIYWMCGNHTLPPEDFAHSSVPKNWQEDLLLPRQWDANGHARGILAPGGFVCKSDPEGKTWEVTSIGYRNAYDMAFNADGELFGYDSDMEWDMGAPWYRPTRVNHAVSGSEFGWRSGTGVWPNHHVDSLPQVLDIGPGSPVGVEFGYGTKFPAKYQKALYLLDWTFGTIYAVHLEPSGASYKAVKEEFVSRTPLPLTDATVGLDGSFYFLTGGRNAQSDVWRVTYAGKESTKLVDGKDTAGADLRALRMKIEQYHSPASDGAKAVEFVYPYLNHEDRFIRYAARVALEHQPAKLWQDKVLAEAEPDRLIGGAVALARQGDKSLEAKLLAALGNLDFAKLNERQKLDSIRAYSLVFIRMGEPDKATLATVAKKFDPFFPSTSDVLNRELIQLLVYSQSPTVLAKATVRLKAPSVNIPDPGLKELLARNKGYGGSIEKMLANSADQEKIAYAFALRNVKEGWTMDQRKAYFAVINEGRTKIGGNSFQGFLNNIEREAFDNATDADRLAIEAGGLRKPFKPKALPTAAGPGKDWKMEDVLALEKKLTGRSFSNGQKMFAAARCIVCHRFYGEGGATGPDMTQSAGRFNFKDMAESILEPSKVISDQYKASVVFTKGEKTLTGKLISDTKEGIAILIDPEDSTKLVEIKRADIDEVKPSATSLMPKDLLKPLNEDEVADLMAYVLSRGDPGHPMFKAEPKKAEPKKKNPKK
ncbi:MAG: c-type cytochrome [Gemmataceae bacterium]|nr:c-type cytochrome [Gemmataceae bacterium]